MMASEASRMADTRNKHIDPLVIEVSHYKSEVIFGLQDLWGCLEVAMASEATNMAVKANMHKDFRLTEVPDHKFDIK